MRPAAWHGPCMRSVSAPQQVREALGGPFLGENVVAAGDGSARRSLCVRSRAGRLARLVHHSMGQRSVVGATVAQTVSQGTGGAITATGR